MDMGLESCKFTEPTTTFLIVSTIILNDSGLCLVNTRIYTWLEKKKKKKKRVDPIRRELKKCVMMVILVPTLSERAICNM